jgi:hypothetical protein
MDNRASLQSSIVDLMEQNAPSAGFVDSDSGNQRSMAVQVGRKRACAEMADSLHTEDRIFQEKENVMGAPVIHFETVGGEGHELVNSNSELFGWMINRDNPMNYGIVESGGSSAGAFEGKQVRE